MDEKRKVIQTGVGVLLVLIVAASFYYFLIYKKAATPSQTQEPSPAVLPEKAAPLGEEKAVPGLPAVELDKSDDLVSQWARELSSHPKLGDWLKSTDLIRRFAAAVDNIANGLSPRSNIDFFSPGGDFKIIKKGNLVYADPDGYNRYNDVADVFVSLDSKRCASLYRGLKSIIQEAYRDLGYPGQDFDETLLGAIAELLETPIVEGDILLEKTVVNYILLDPTLEDLSEAQKHLLRMGPENAGAIQTKLREMAAALGFPDSRLPTPRTYKPQL